jgi:hypothetical protein
MKEIMVILHFEVQNVMLNEKKRWIPERSNIEVKISKLGNPKIIVKIRTQEILLEIKAMTI